MRINVAIPEAHVEAPVLDAALEATTRLNEAMIEDGSVPTFKEGLKHGVQWKPEPFSEEHFDHAKTVFKRGWGDCDDLAPWQAASLRATGVDPDAKAIVRRSGPKRWHAIVQRGDGSLEDPSRQAGMGQPKPILGAAVPLMYTPPSAVVGGTYIVRPAIAMRPFRGGVQARADMPWHWQEHLSDKPRPTDYAMTTLHTAPIASTALTGAIVGALELAVAGGYAHPAHIARLAAIADAVEGIPLEDVAACYGDEHAEAARQVLGAFGFLKKIAKGALKVAPGIAKFVPGGAQAMAALDIAKQAKGMLSKKRGSAPSSSPAPQRAAQQAQQQAQARPAQGGGTPDSPIVPEPSPTNPFPSVESWARQGRLCIPCTFE